MDRFSKSTQILNFMKILPVGAVLLLSDRWTDMNLTAAFRNFANAPKIHSLTDVCFILKCFSFLLRE